jgi:hypothetical protein
MNSASAMLDPSTAPAATTQSDSLVALVASLRVRPLYPTYPLTRQFCRPFLHSGFAPKPRVIQSKDK